MKPPESFIIQSARESFYSLANITTNELRKMSGGVTKVTFYNVKVPDDVPKTGDTMHFFLWGGIGILSIAGIAGVLVLRRKKK